MVEGSQRQIDAPLLGLACPRFQAFSGRDELSKLFEVVRGRLEILGREQVNGSEMRRVRVLGRLDFLPTALRRQADEVETQTQSGGPHLLNILVAYGGRDEVLDAVKRMLRSRGTAGESAGEIAQRLTEQELQSYLHAPDVPNPDHITRTSGGVRLSGFLIWQSIHSELYFCDAPWPAFRKIDFLRAIRSFQARQRRYGR